VTDSSDLPSQIAGIKPGTTADVQVWRDKSSKTVKVMIGSLQDAKIASNEDSPAQLQSRLGVAVRPLTPQEKSGASITHGLLVQQSGGPAASAGIQAGDVILAVNGRPVSDVEQLKQAVSKAGNSLALLIQRDSAQIFVPVDLG
jgi:serine protease Do